jgi:hypothetical protein
VGPSSCVFSADALEIISGGLGSPPSRAWWAIEIGNMNIPRTFFIAIGGSKCYRDRRSLVGGDEERRSVSCW